MSVEAKKTVQTLVTEREQQGIEVAKNVVRYLKTLGFLRPDGDFSHEEGSVRFLWNRLFNVVTIEHGGIDVFRANLDNDACPLFKQGTWKMSYDEIMRRFDSTPEQSIYRHEVRMRELMGIPVNG